MSGVTSARARALYALAAGTARVVVASAAALLPRVSAPRARCSGPSIELKPGQDIAPTDLGELLVDAGFTREDPADEHGEFAIRGGILDIFPPARGERSRSGSSSSATRSSRCASTTRRRSGRSSRSIR